LYVDAGGGGGAAEMSLWRESVLVSDANALSSPTTIEAAAAAAVA
jgi:hypothetical protein